MSGMVPFKFEEFYRAFGKSVSSDVVFADGEIHIVQHKASSSLNDINSRNNRAALEPAELPATSDPLKQHAKGRLLDSADRRRLPWAIRALLDIQEADGSWVFSNKFEFVINGVAPPPINGVASKLWATAVVITVWRQFPEYFELLETHYEKAMLHADENVLRIVRSVLQFDSLDKVNRSFGRRIQYLFALICFAATQIRAYEDNEARAIREQLAREAAAKLELELEEEEKIARLREEEIRIGKLSLVHARRLPMPTQKLLVAGLGDELDGVLSRSAATKAKSQPTGSSTTFQCAVENASTTAFIWKGDDFVLTFVRSLDFLGDCRELVEWYGEEFPLDANPFMLSLSLLDKAADRGLRLSQQYTTARTNPLRLAHRCAADDEQSSPPTWWPETRYSSELRHRIEQSEQELFRELVLAHWLEVQGGGRTRGGPITIVGAQPRDVAKQTVA
ncbi:hypothetical protein PHYBOEH_011974 [Phytophthora boehmeriae]|uniref:Uncharacterized protein n=1 Tax=Phytophthora boehmeriae TaxID=109152 RepID=A0A8T1WVP6_9STRA|nr:hypothetical protein PHYBOEH_011974 [Phytophthora boehmeriae]